MSEPWKVVTCPEDCCTEQMFDADGAVREGFHITPEIDTDYMTQFTCPRCGHVETWGPTRRMIALTLYEKYYHG